MKHICRETVPGDDSHCACLAAHGRAALLWFIPVEGGHSRPPSERQVFGVLPHRRKKIERLIKLFVITRGVGFVAGSCREPSLPMTLAESRKAEDSASGAAPVPAGEPPRASLWSGFLSSPVICNSFVPLIYQEFKDDFVKKVEEQIIYIINLFSSFPSLLPLLPSFETGSYIAQTSHELTE